MDFGETDLYEGGIMPYFTGWYYAALSTFGTETYPTQYLELVASIIVNVAGPVVLGLTIGEFANILDKITR